MAELARPSSIGLAFGQTDCPQQRVTADRVWTFDGMRFPVCLPYTVYPMIRLTYRAFGFSVHVREVYMFRFRVYSVRMILH